MIALIRHGDVEVLNTRGNIADDLADLFVPIGADRAVDEDSHRHLILADAVDPSGKMVLSAEGRLQEAVDDLAIGKRLLLCALTRSDAACVRNRR